MQLNKIDSCLWMINHYTKLLQNCDKMYIDMVDYYIMYDHYSTYVQKYKDKLAELSKIQ